MTIEDLQAKYPDLLSKCEINILDGWLDLVDKMCAELVELSPTIRLEQIKEKFGTLRAYTTWVPNPEQTDLAAHYIIIRYEGESQSICEFTGRSGQLHQLSKHGWIKCVCPEVFEASKLKGHWTHD